ncbi:MAG: D-alanine--poly(phosphoribitol) ligase subunit 2 [Clostridia bacterium]|nr:D-alanine--poly(phosphoribitol) ligase subunit 2 [Clostridia bacterium]MBQ6906322.1 D-alanine--poly(phosphoribitol) ligase subunit 2 [Clostridia bacterium]
MVKKRIIEILVELTGADELFGDESIDLFDSGIMDSFTYGELLYALEDEFGVEIQPTQVEVDVWRSVERIAALVDELR